MRKALLLFAALGLAGSLWAATPPKSSPILLPKAVSFVLTSNKESRGCPLRPSPVAILAGVVVG